MRRPGSASREVPAATAPPADDTRWRRLGDGLPVVWMLAALQGVAGCRDDGPASPLATATATATAPALVAPVAPAAPAADPERHGQWLGGPEPASGKLRSGIVGWWRLEPAQPVAGAPFELVLRLEDVTANDAGVSIAPGDGARLADAAAPVRWTLRRGQPAEIRLRLLAPPGDSYLHVSTRQAGRSSVRSIRLSMPGDPAASAPARGDVGVDARGEPVVRMPAGR